MFPVSLFFSTSCSSTNCSSNRVLLHNGKQASIQFLFNIHPLLNNPSTHNPSTNQSVLGHRCDKLQKLHILSVFFLLCLCSAYVELVWDPVSRRQSVCLSDVCHRLKEDYSIFEGEQSKPVKVKPTLTHYTFNLQ